LIFLCYKISCKQREQTNIDFFGGNLLWKQREQTNLIPLG